MKKIIGITAAALLIGATQIAIAHANPVFQLPECSRDVVWPKPAGGENECLLHDNLGHPMLCRYSSWPPVLPEREWGCMYL